MAASNNLFYSFKELLNNGANLNFITEPEEDTILHIAVKNINHEMIKLILHTNYMNLEERNKEGKTARDLALEIEPIKSNILFKPIEEKNKNKEFEEKNDPNINKQKQMTLIKSNKKSKLFDLALV